MHAMVLSCWVKSRAICAARPSPSAALLPQSIRLGKYCSRLHIIPDLTPQTQAQKGWLLTI